MSVFEPVFRLSDHHAIVFVTAPFILHPCVDDRANWDVYVVRTQPLKIFHDFAATRLLQFSKN